MITINSNEEAEALDKDKIMFHLKHECKPFLYKAILRSLKKDNIKLNKCYRMGFTYVASGNPTIALTFMDMSSENYYLLWINKENGEFKLETYLPEHHKKRYFSSRLFKRILKKLPEQNND